MKMLSACLLLLSASIAVAFTSLSQRQIARGGSPLVSSSHVLFSTASAPQQKSWNTLHQFNVDLDKLAEEAGSFRYPVISKASECEKLWEETLKDGSSNVVPDTVSFNTVLKAWNRCCHVLSEGARQHKNLKEDVGHEIDVYTPRDAATHATTLLVHQQESETAKPDVLSYNIVIDTWSKSRVNDAPETAERLLKQMLKNDSVEPDTVTYHGVLSSWANSGRPEALKRVEQILSHMEALHAEGNDNVKPTIRTINTMLNAYAKRAGRLIPQLEGKDPVKLAELGEDSRRLLEKCKRRYEETGDPEWQPDIQSYTCVMDVYARACTYAGTQAAEELLEEVKEEYQKTGRASLMPNFRTYTTLIAAWARIGSDDSPRRVDEILDEMSQNIATRPTARTYTSAIQCWSRSRDNNKAKQALRILKKTRDLYEETQNEDFAPTILTYNSVIDACSKCQGSLEQQTEALKIAFAIQKALQVDKFVEANDITYSALLRAVLNLLPSGAERNKIASVVFEKAKKDGLVHLDTVKFLRRAVDFETMQSATEGNVDEKGNFDYGALPPTWSRNSRWDSLRQR